MIDVNKPECNCTDFDHSVKNGFLALQRYNHQKMRHMRVSQFMHFHGNVRMFSQQGLIVQPEQ